MTPSVQPLERAPLSNDIPRVLHVISGMALGGAEKVASQLAVHRGGQAGIAWLKGPNAWGNLLDDTQVNLTPLGMGSIRQLPRALDGLSRVVRTYRPDIVHTHLVHANVIGRWAARRAGLPFVSTEHNLRVYDRADLRLLKPLDVRSSRRAAAVVAISEAVRERCLAAGYRRDTLHVVYNGVEVPAALPPSPVNERPVVTMVGRLRSAKGADLFVKAIELLPQVDAILIGDGDDRSLVKELIAGMERPDRLRWLPDGDAMAAMAAADVVVVPSRHEGLGLVAIEAMALGRPVVATRIGGLVEVVQNGITGMLVEPESPEAIAAAVAKLLGDRTTMSNMGLAGRQRADERFSLQRMLEGYEQIYRAVLCKNR